MLTKAADALRHQDGTLARLWPQDRKLELPEASSKAPSNGVVDVHERFSHHSTSHRYMNLSSYPLTFKVRASIIDTIIGELFFAAADGESYEDDHYAGDCHEEDEAAGRRALTSQKETHCVC